ncbi:MAG: glycosyltransferase family 2 protein [Syntrophobacteraceae bacterium]
MLVSVVIPTYNRAELVVEAVASVLEQRGAPRMEVIVVDDGSSDGSGRMVEERFGPGVLCIRRAERGGVSAARNTGIRAAQGEWLAFLDSDDLWRPEKLAAQCGYFVAHPGMLICQTEEVWMRGDRRLNPRNHHEKPEGRCFPLLLERCLVSPSAVMLHRDLLDDVGLFDETLPACEDYDLWLRIGCRYPIGIVRKALVVKRGGRPDQLSSNIPALDQYRIRAIARLLRSGVLGGDDRRVALDVLERKCRIYGEGCRKRGRDEEADAVLRLLLEARGEDLGAVEGAQASMTPEPPR